MQTFKSLDKNGDGVLSRQEILEGLKTYMPSYQAELEVNKIMESVDIDQSGSIDYSEFILATMDKKKAISKERLQESFKVFDADGNGYITADELKAVLGNTQHGQKLNESVWDEIIKETDSNGDGKISFEEFSNLMFKFIE